MSKVVYLTKQEAKDAVRRLRKQGQHTKVYRCAFCERWHLTHANHRWKH